MCVYADRERSVDVCEAEEGLRTEYQCPGIGDVVLSVQLLYCVEGRNDTGCIRGRPGTPVVARIEEGVVLRQHLGVGGVTSQIVAHEVDHRLVGVFLLRKSHSLHLYEEGTGGVVVALQFLGRKSAAGAVHVLEVTRAGYQGCRQEEQVCKYLSAKHHGLQFYVDIKAQ